MKIYVAHPYGRRRNLPEYSIATNVGLSIRAGRELIKRGHIPFIPNLYHFVDKYWDESCSEERWAEISASWIECCDALLYCAPSEGCDKELQIAKELGKQIFYDLEEIPLGSSQEDNNSPAP